MDIIWIIVMVKGKLITIKNLAYVIMIISWLKSQTFIHEINFKVSSFKMF